MTDNGRTAYAALFHSLFFSPPPWNESNGSEVNIWLNLAFLHHSAHHLRLNECTAHCVPRSLLPLLPTLFLSFVVFIGLVLHANISIPVSSSLSTPLFSWSWIFLCTWILMRNKIGHAWCYRKINNYMCNDVMSVLLLPQSSLFFYKATICQQSKTC